MTLPIMLPGIIGIALFGFTLSYDEFARTVLTSGSENTLPLEIWTMTTNVTSPALYARWHGHHGRLVSWSSAPPSARSPLSSAAAEPRAASPPDAPGIPCMISPQTTGNGRIDFIERHQTLP